MRIYENSSTFISARTMYLMKNPLTKTLYDGIVTEYMVDAYF